jgi:hypothetical protein
MKKLLLSATLLFSISFFASAQVNYINARLNYIDGKGPQLGKIDAGGIGVQYERFKSPASKIGYIITLESNYSGMETREADLSFGGSNAKTDVNYYSSLNKLTGGGIYSPLHGAFVSPYISVQGGVMWYHTKLVIEDPDDPSACSPVQSKNVKLSLAAIGNVESGVKIRMRKSNINPWYIQASVGYNFGSEASYIKLGDEPNDETTQPFNTKFKMSNGSIHEHSIGTMYRTRTSQLVYSLGVSFSFE